MTTLLPSVLKNTLFCWLLVVIWVPATGKNGTIALSIVPDSSESRVWSGQTTCGQSFTAGAYPDLIGSTSAVLGWGSTDGVTATVRWRAVTNPNWTYITDIASTSVALTGLIENDEYAWGIQLTCADGSVSRLATGLFRTYSCQPPQEVTVSSLSRTSTAVLVTWVGFHPALAGDTFEMQWRAQNAPNWTTITNLPINSQPYSLTGLSARVQYEVRMKAVCSPTISSTYSPATVFQPQCQTPYSLSGYPLVSGFDLSWSSTETAASFEVQWHSDATTTWSTVPNLVTEQYYPLRGLLPATHYAFRVRAVCNDGTTSGYVENSDRTEACVEPAYQFIASITNQSALISWSVRNYTAETRFDVHWKRVGQPTSTTVSSLTTASYALTGLLPGTAYEWQVRAICVPGYATPFTNLATFTTTGTACTTMQTIKSGNWNDPTVWSCGRLPTMADAVLLKHLISLPANVMADALRVQYEPGIRLALGSGARLRLGLP